MKQTEEQMPEQTEQVTPAVVAVSATKPIDSYFTIEHQSMIAAKYEKKYDASARREHREKWPEFAGNYFTLYILAETLTEARKAVFSENVKIYLRKVQSAMEDYTPTTPGAVLTELQVSENKATDAKLQALYELCSDEDDRSVLCKRFADLLKLQSKTGKDTDRARAVFYHAAATLGITPNSIW